MCIPYSSIGDGHHTDTICTYNWTCSDFQSPVSFSFHLPVDYPEVIPAISVSSSSLKRQKCTEIANALTIFAKDLIGQSMLMDLIIWIQENCACILVDTKDQPERPHCECDNVTALFQLDHMRSKEKYAKTIKKWADELNLSGRLLFVNRLIFIILQGNKKSVKVRLY